MAVVVGLPSWERIAEAGEHWARLRRPRSGDTPLTLYRDANAWCPFCHRVFFFMEQKGLRYTTERIHLQGDPAEPPKQKWYRALVPSGAVPAVRIRDEVVPESLDILERLEAEFPEPRMLPQGFEFDNVRRLCDASALFNTDDSDWLHNRRREKEEALKDDMLRRFKWLEEALAAYGGPFFLGGQVSLVDAAFVGFLTRCAHNYLFFKGLNVRDEAAWPRLAAWFRAMEALPAYQATKQDAAFEQRIYQSHPDRRPGAEGCMRLGRTGSCVGEPDCSLQPAWPEAPLEAGSMAALEAASRLCERRAPLLQFLLRKQQTSDAGAHLSSEEGVALLELQLQMLTSVLCGLVTPEAADESLPGGRLALQSGVMARLGELIGTPRDMSSAAAAQVRAALAALAVKSDLQARPAGLDHGSG